MAQTTSESPIPINVTSLITVSVSPFFTAQSVVLETPANIFPGYVILLPHIFHVCGLFLNHHPATISSKLITLQTRPKFTLNPANFLSPALVTESATGSTNVGVVVFTGTQACYEFTPPPIPSFSRQLLSLYYAVYSYRIDVCLLLLCVLLRVSSPV